MSQAFAVEEIIGHPAPRVWAALTDWPNAHQWMPGIDTITADGETAEGTRLTFRARGKDRSSAIVRCVDGQSLVLRSVQGGVTADYTYEVHGHDDGLFPGHPDSGLPGHGRAVAADVAPAAHRHPNLRRQAAQTPQSHDRTGLIPRLGLGQRARRALRTSRTYSTAMSSASSSERSGLRAALAARSALRAAASAGSRRPAVARSLGVSGPPVSSSIVASSYVEVGIGR